MRRGLMWRDFFSGPVLIIAAKRRRLAGRPSVRNSAFWTCADFPRTIFIIIKRGGRIIRSCICCRTGTGRARKGRTLTPGRTTRAGGRTCPWPAEEGQEIEVGAHNNWEEGDLFLNGGSRGRKPMTKNSHLEWKVKYASGILLARGYTGGKEILTDKVETTGAPAAIQLTPHRPSIKADGEDVSVITVQANDAQQRMVPDVGNE